MNYEPGVGQKNPLRQFFFLSERRQLPSQKYDCVCSLNQVLTESISSISVRNCGCLKNEVRENENQMVANEVYGLDVAECPISSVLRLPVQLLQHAADHFRATKSKTRKHAESFIFNGFVVAVFLFGFFCRLSGVFLQWDELVLTPGSLNSANNSPYLSKNCTWHNLNIPCVHSADDRSTSTVPTVNAHFDIACFYEQRFELFQDIKFFHQRKYTRVHLCCCISYADVFIKKIKLLLPQYALDGAHENVYSRLLQNILSQSVTFAFETYF